MPLILDIADALVSELNTAPPGTFIQSFTAVRAYRPQFDLAQLKSLRVSVVPKSLEIASLIRSANQHDLSVDVAVQQKVQADDPAQLDGLMQLVEQIATYVRLRRLTAFAQAIWVKTENAPIYAPEHLEQKQVFTSVLTFTFRVMQ